MKILSLAALSFVMQTQTPEWQLVGMTKAPAPTLLFIDRLNVKRDVAVPNVIVYEVSEQSSSRVFRDFDCAARRVRVTLIDRDGSGNQPIGREGAWSAVGTGSALELPFDFVCRGEGAETPGIFYGGTPVARARQLIVTMREKGMIK